MKLEKAMRPKPNPDRRCDLHRRTGPYEGDYELVAENLREEDADLILQGLNQRQAVLMDLEAVANMPHVRYFVELLAMAKEANKLRI
jgi:hypothetical protein